MVLKLLLLLNFLFLTTLNSRIKEIFHIKETKFLLSNNDAKNESQYLNQVNAMPVTLERWKNKLFLVTPRFKQNIPATLSYLDITNLKTMGNYTPIFIPYPNQNVHDISSHNLTSVVIVRADVCDRLWILDSGKINNNREIASSIHIYDLRTDTHLRTFSLESLSNTNSDFSNIIIDVTSSTCEDAYAYVPDSDTYRLIVYRWKTNDSNAISHNYFHFDPIYGDFNFGSVHYQSQKGLYGISLSPVERDSYRTVYFHSIASTMGFTVSSKILQDWKYDQNKDVYEFKVMGSRGMNKQAKSSTLDMETGVLFYGLVLKNIIGCWNSYSGEEYNEHTQSNIILDNDQDLFPSDVRVDKTGNLWVLSNTLPIYINNNFDQSYINTKIYMTPVRQIIKGTVCDEM
ncbi:protein yellow-like [Daktulosphaira vitifoliae]|uniref:protein yellow-like n=1 Tax=Daktulosphaira vitifoliae TaxID=58002 RepID=UPI0021AA85E0|nr:protein yellow-like [Daktulosphaira vitifoliae]